jgi:hypothetical protein
MGGNSSDETELVVVTSLSVLLNVMFGVIELLIDRKNIPRSEIVELLQQLRSEAKSYEQGEEMAIELLDGALYRVAKTTSPIAAGGSGSAPKAAQAA